MSLSSSNVSVRGVMELVANMADHAGEHDSHWQYVWFPSWSAMLSQDLTF